MTDQEFEKEVENLMAYLHSFRLIKDRGRKPWLRKIITALIVKLLKD